MSSGYDNEVQEVFSEITDVPKAAVVEMLKRKTINASLPIYLPGNLRADLSGIVGAIIFGNGEVEGSLGMINRKGSTSEIEYTPNLLIGGTLRMLTVASGTVAGGTVAGGTATTAIDVLAYTSSTYPKPNGLAVLSAQDFVSDRVRLDKPTAGYRSPTTVQRLSFTQPNAGLFEATFVSTDKLSLEKSKTGLSNKVYAVVLDGNIKAGVGFLLRGPTQSMARAIGNLQDASDTTTEIFRLESVEESTP
jgi:hypothetical protein